MHIKDKLKQIVDWIIKLNYQISTDVFRKINLIIGYILLTPCLFGVFYFIKGLFKFGTIAFLFGYFGYIKKTPIQLNQYELEPRFMEIINDSPFPLHFALMAIAGAYLITNNSKSNTKTGTKD
jgi:hypothetical protein